MKNIKKIFFSAVVFVSLFSFSNAGASTGTYSQNMWVSRHGSSVNQVINTPPFGTEKQTYSVNVSGNYDGHGGFGPSGGKYGISVCINNVGAMWNGSCWTIVDANGAGNIGDASGSIPNTTVDIGNTSNNFNYVSADVYVNDADANVTITMYGREVSINGFNTTNSTVAVGGQFDVTWDASERTGDSVLTFSGPVNCGNSSPYNTGNNSGGLTCTGTSAGTATFSLQATGYGGYGTKSVTSQPISVNIVQPPVSCGNNTVEAGEQCDTGSNNGSCPRTCSNACTVNTCSAPLCGNGVVNAGEQCDNGVNNGASPRACSSYCTNNSVSGTVNISLTVNGPGTVGSNLVPGRFGPGAYSGTIFTNTFVQFDVIPNPGEASSWTWGGPCSFFNSPLSSVCSGNATVDTANVVTFIPIPITGTLTPANSSCTIPVGQSGCYQTLTWSTSGFTNGSISSVTSWTGIPGTVYGNSGSASFYAPYNPSDTSVEFYLNNPGVLATAVVNPTCVAGTVWSGGACTLVSSPTVDSVVISSGSVTPDGSTQYTVTIRGTDSGGGDKIRYEYALINLAGTNSASPRGWLAWNLTDPWVSHKQPRACGAGYAAILSSSPSYNIYGHDYVNLVGCTNTVSGNQRTTVFTVTFPTTFTSPLTLNDIAGAVHNSDGNWNSNSDAGIWPWRNFDINFSLYIPPPTNLVVTCPAPGTSLNATWTSPGAGYNTFYYRASTPSTDWSGNVEQSTVTGTSKSRASTAGQSYNVWVHTRHPSDPAFWSSLISQTVTCALPGAPVVTLTASPNPVTSGNSTTLTWTVSGATSCTSVGANAIPAGNWSTAGNGNVSSGAIASARTYQLSCTGTGGTTLSPSVTVNVSATPTLTANPASVAPGQNVTVDFNNVPTPTTRDWIGSYLTSAANGSPEIAYIYTSSCTTAAGASTPTNGSCSFTMPVTPGSYNLRLSPNDLYSPTLAVSNTVTVTAPSTFTLTVVANSSLGGRVTSPGIIDCGIDCSENVSSGSNVTLTAVPSSSYWRFNGWSGACSGNNTVCTINNITATVSDTALFVPRAFIYKEF